jgi:uncharacterized membrane protein YjjP (DUF1212 family)
MAEIKDFQEIPGSFTNGDMSDLKQKFNDLHRQTEQYVRDNPMQAILSAVGAGFVLRLLPLGAILGLIVRVLLSLARPALFIYGAVAVYKHFVGEEEVEQ